ncbi:MAG: 23S rRNA (guanosine(2251)-2'-O)-methyltransferase RlmB [Gammaproteobacteria bacterium]
MTGSESWVKGIHAIEELLERRPKSVHVLRVNENKSNSRIVKICNTAAEAGIKIEKVSGKELDAMFGHAHQGVVALVDGLRGIRDEKTLLAMLSERRQVLLLVLDCVTDPHNLGACLRTADAAGVDAVIVPKDKSAQMNDTVAKVASGAAETVNLVAVTNLARFLSAIKELGIWVAGTDDQADTGLYSADLTGPLAIVMGAEGEGMRRLTREQCDYLLSIPMLGELSSLNVSVAAGVVLFEAVRQRSREG